MLKIAFYLNIISPHQLPLAREVVRLVGEDCFRYVFVEDFHADRRALGWDDGNVPTWCIKGSENSPVLIEADLVYTGIRCLGLIAKRSRMGKKTAYFSERWFKPRVGVLRLLSPSYWQMAREFVHLMDDAAVTYLSCGIHASSDMARLWGLMHGDLRCVFRAPKLEFERSPGGKIWLESKPCNAQRHCLEEMRMWGYFVEPSLCNRFKEKCQKPNLRVIWVGRLLELKRVDAIIRAVGELAARVNITLDIYGKGPEEKRLKVLAKKYGNVIRFFPPVPINEVRILMSENDAYVLSSNGFEGWGAVVSEALEEGMRVVGTYEAGASATILPESRLFHAGDWRMLLTLLERESKWQLPPCSIGDWTANVAAKQLLTLI